MRANDGTLRNVLISASVYRVDGRFVHIRCVTHDVTARYHAEERLRQSAKMEAIGQLAGGLAHDFNNQLHALSGLIDFVAMDEGLSEASRTDLAEIQNTTERMASLTRQLLAFSRQQVLIPETVDLNAAVTETKPMLQRLVGSNLEMHLELAADPTWVKVDRSQLLQVLMNLVINARDAMPRGGQLIIRTGRHEVRGRELDSVARGPVLPGSYARLTVEDAGTGIPAADLSRIFEAFFTTKPVGEGTGLGLATVDGILSQSKGHIWAESEANRGATFHVLLPLVGEPSEPVSEIPALPARPRRRGRLLIVDDEAMVREVIVRTLANHGYEVHQAEEGKGALEQLKRLAGEVDLVVSDVVMPVMGGAELSLKLAEHYPGIPIIWMSGYPRETVIGRGRLGEDQPFLQKPVPPAVLLEAVGRAVKA
jgi:signal transduction histidine kinase/CheY-like chemotaxis protein